MHPELFTLPIIGYPIKTYGFCLMVGFLSAVWLAMRRAERVKASADTVLDLSFLALLFGVGGARVFYVAHYWQTQFAQRANPWLAAINITEGGLEFIGGFIGASAAIVGYAVWKRIPLRLYLDILAPSTMWGLAIGRLGCFMNGCCFGGACLAPGTVQAAYPWAVRFPYGSPAFWHEWEDRKVTVPAELIVSLSEELEPALLPASALATSVEQRQGSIRELADAAADYDRAKAEGVEPKELAELQAGVDAAKKRVEAQQRTLATATLARAQQFPSREVPTRRTSVSELQELAAGYRSQFVHPTQLYAAINALLICAVLSVLFHLRKRHGVVVGAMLIMYPIPRFLIEYIRADNPHDVGGLTISQFIVLGLLVIGGVYLYVLYKWLPERSLE